MIVVFSTGQSNMMTGYPLTWTPPSNLYIWDFNAVTDASSAVGTAFVSPSGLDIGTSLAACAEIAKANPTEDVYLINIAKGGLALPNWGTSPPSYNFRQAIDGNLPVALAAIGATGIDYFVWGGAEGDVSVQSGTIVSDFETNVMSWMQGKAWFSTDTISYIMGFTPYAQSAPGNGDYLWKRYSGTMRAIAAKDPAYRRYVSIDSMPISMFDPSGALPYIHRTPEGYYHSGIRLSNAILLDAVEPVQRAELCSGFYSATLANLSTGLSSPGAANGHFTRNGNVISATAQFAINTVAGAACTFDIPVPIKAKNFPAWPTGVIGGSNGESGVIAIIPSSNSVRGYFPAKITGATTISIAYSYRVEDRDQLPNSPPGTT